MLSGDDGVFGSLRDGGYIVDMSTVPPDFARELAERAKDAGYRALDACVYGAPMHARSGELRVMVGGDEGGLRRDRGHDRRRSARRSPTSARTGWARR